LGIFDTIKKLFTTQNEIDIKSKSELRISNHLSHATISVKANAYFSSIKNNRFTSKITVDLKSESQSSWNAFFSVSKTNPKFIGFEQRSRKKFKHLYHDHNLLVVQSASVVEYVTKEEIRQIHLKETPFEKMSFINANPNGVILHNKENVAIINKRTNQATLFEFEWQPFTFAMGNDFWLVGTRETYNGPGELYCFDFAGNVKWAILFKESFSSMFGDLTFMPYILEVSTDSSDIFVASMDRLYRLDINGNLLARVAVSDVKEKELKQKEKEFQSKLSVQPKTKQERINLYAEQMAAQFSLSLERMTINSPFAGFAHDPETDMLFLLEEKGRVSAWDHQGNLIWINSFKNEGRYISWTDCKLVVSFSKGETFWIDRDGKFIYGVKLPKQATTINLIPNQNKYLVVCEDNRLYELEKDNGELIMGSEGHPGMELFRLSHRNIFFDGTKNGQGYFWLAPPEHEWTHFKPTMISEEGVINTIDNEVAPEITATKKFTKSWAIKSKKDWFGSRVIDFINKRIYLVEQADKISIEKRMNLSEKERQKEYLKHYLVCYDFDSKEIWRKQMLSSMWSLFLSPDGEFIFTSEPLEAEITYLPGNLLILSKEGTVVNKIKVPAHGFQLEFNSKEQGIIRFITEKGTKPLKGTLEITDNRMWNITIDQEFAPEAPFGTGLHYSKLKHYKLTRTDKKIYLLEGISKQLELKLPAAIYEAIEAEGNYLLLRIGTRTVQYLNTNLEKIFEIKEQENIMSIATGLNSFLVLTKNEAKGYSYQGKLIWKYSSLPKTHETKAFWITSEKSYIWITENNLEASVAKILEDGIVKKSQLINKKLYHRPIIVSKEEECFVIQSNEGIEAYKI
jgi:hypothetical protein